ncbi:MAG TPA: NAD-dependent epimerase/dehydratase family protein [Thermoleophilaceae bacterium]|nr:NAD-dependent epimerase/dehydratase family protein [Thermoleophilaceae bacterium]
MRLLVTGASGFLGSRVTRVLRERGHEVVAVTRPGPRRRAALDEIAPVEADAGGPEVRELVAGSDAVLHFAGVPDPDGARRDPARAVRENAGTTVNLLEACVEHGAGLVYPSSVRAAVEPPPDPYALSKRLGEEACRLHRAPATVLRLTSVFGPGQLVPEGATGAIAAFAWRALSGEPIEIPGDPERTRDFVYVDDFATALERVVADRRFDETLTVASGVATPLIEAARLVKEAARSTAPIETPGGRLAPGENESYPSGAGLAFTPRPLAQTVELYVDWLRRHHPAQGSA